MAKLFESIGKLGLALAIGGGIVNSALYNGKQVEHMFAPSVVMVVTACPALPLRHLDGTHVLLNKQINEKIAFTANIPHSEDFDK